MILRDALLLISVWVALSSSLTGCSPEGDSDESDSAMAGGTDTPVLTLELDASQRAQLGVVLVPIDTAQFEQRVEGPGIVVDAQPVVQVLAALTAAEDCRVS